MKKALTIIAIITGILLILQIRSFKEVEFLIQRSGSVGILSELRTLQLANVQLKSILIEKEKGLEDMQKKVSASSILENEINRLRSLSGEVAVSGPGIEIIFSTDIQAFWISDIIAQLVSAGAEAIAINDIRLTERTAGFRNVGGGLLMRRNFILPPIKITAIGNKQALAQAINQNGGILTNIKNSVSKLKVSLTEYDKIVIPALNESTQ